MEIASTYVVRPGPPFGLVAANSTPKPYDVTSE